MAEPLKNHFDERIPRKIAADITAVWPGFRSRAFLKEVLAGYGALELMDRGRHIARVLRRYLPDDYVTALGILMQSVGDRPKKTDGDGGMASFFYLPHTCLVAEFGLDHFDESMRAQYVLTQRFTAEFSIRPFIARYETRALALLRTWAMDSNVHVRRLVSEGTRPRLPWAGRLRGFQRDPTPVLGLLELLKDDPEEYVRRSVANNLNDVGKDHPEVLVAVARRWLLDGGAERQALIRHALRSLVKQGHSGALEALGYGTKAAVAIDDVHIAPARVARGGRVAIQFDVRSTSHLEQRVLVDFRVHFVRGTADRTSAKVFKLRTVVLAAGGRATFRKTVSLADLTTRRHYPGRHAVDVLVNGQVMPLGSFTIVG
jgi:3-methyladenine DNA glycosylase AlkC